MTEYVHQQHNCFQCIFLISFNINKEKKSKPNALSLYPDCPFLLFLPKQTKFLLVSGSLYVKCFFCTVELQFVCPDFP